jgi:hypothetical protein
LLGGEKKRLASEVVGLGGRGSEAWRAGSAAVWAVWRAWVRVAREGDAGDVTVSEELLALRRLRDAHQSECTADDVRYLVLEDVLELGEELHQPWVGCR